MNLPGEPTPIGGALVIVVYEGDRVEVYRHETLQDGEHAYSAQTDRLRALDLADLRSILNRYYPAVVSA